MTLYQSGLAQDVLLNINPIGVTVNGKMRVNLGQVLNFQNSVIQFLCGTVRLVSHCVTGFAKFGITYSLSGVDEEEEGIEQEERPKKKIIPAPRERDPRTTPGLATGVEVKLDRGLTLAERLAIVNAGLNADYRRKGGVKYGKISNWPITICRTLNGLVRSRWSCFAMFATNDVNFFRQLGYSNAQIFPINYDGELLYGLGELPMATGDVTGVEAPQLEAIGVAPSTFYLLPRRDDVYLEVDTYLHETPATPAALKAVLDTLIVNLNKKYRTSILEQIYAERFVWPGNSRADYNADTGVITTDLYPYNIFPLSPSYDGEAVELEVNTDSFVGSIRNVKFGERNIFGFSNEYNTWNLLKRKKKNEVIRSITTLGVRGQVCEISSTQMFQSRALLTPDSVNASIVALFLAPGQPTTFPMTFFPKNLLSSSVSYNTLDFNVCSRYVHDMIVTQEEYEYILLGEIRGLD